MALSREDIEEILRIVDGAPVGELQLRTEGFMLHLVIGDGPATTVAQGAGSPLAARPAPAVPSAVPGSPPPATAAAAAAAPPVPEPAATSGPDATTVNAAAGMATVDAPMLGTFYRAESPGAATFVEVGTRVEPDTIVCIIEVMKMMNSVPAGVGGTVVEVLADNGMLVEFGQPLFLVEP